MTKTLLLANVGNRDVQIPDSDDLPKKARDFGEAILADWSAYADKLTFPILGKALQWVAGKHGPVERIILVASDQKDEHHRHSDTAPLAEVIQRAFSEKPKWRKHLASPDAIVIERCHDNPSDYDDMMRFYETQMARLAGDRASIVYLEVSGGTPAMAAMLLLKGIEHFGERAQPLYVTPTQAMPLSLNVGRQLTLDATTNDLKHSLNICQYHTALALLDSREQLLRESWPHFSAVRAVVDYARERLNFNFLAAEQALFGADRHLPSRLTSRVRDFANDISERTETWLLREVLYTAEISFRNGAYADFLGRAFRLSEGLTDHVLKAWAPPEIFEGPEEKRKVADGWLNDNVDAREFLEEKEIDLGRCVTRLTLLTLAEYFAGQDDMRRRIVNRLQRINVLGSYRNQMPFAHGYEGVSPALLKQRYGGKRDDEMLRDLRWLYEQIVGQPCGDNPYDAINALIFDLIQTS